ncbi:hypothetical protein [Bacillus sp. THAF10]|uniref:hypothetical protein n=1 Tax=Bacillus sp. THAF10 TaxID=2587848 RepID=UPI0012691C19|nr:hypothetical protein [Bacillus sp. THAF10]
MKRYLLFVLIVAAIQIGILVGISMYFDKDLMNTMFLGSCIFIILAMIMSSSGDALTKNSEVAVFDSLLGSYNPKHEKPTFFLTPLLSGSFLTLIIYFITYYIIY